MKRDSNIEKELDKAVTLMDKKFACSNSKYLYVEEVGEYIFYTDLVQKNGCTPHYIIMIDGDNNRGCLSYNYSNDHKAAEVKYSKLLKQVNSKRYYVGLDQEENNVDSVSIIDFNPVYGKNLGAKIVKNLVGLVLTSYTN